MKSRSVASSKLERLPEARSKRTRAKFPWLEKQDRRTFVSGHNAFATALHRQLAEGDGNRVCAPISVRAALALAAAGARGETRSLLAETLGFGIEPELVVAGYGRHAFENERILAHGMGALLASGVWVQQGAPVTAAFRELLERYEPGALQEAHFAGEAEAARRRINAWVSERTREQIPELVMPGVLGPETRLVLASACQFQALWRQPFDPADTRPLDFRLEHGERVSVSAMRQRIEKLPFARLPGCTAIRLDYHNTDLRFVAVLPDEADGLPALEAGLSAEWLDALEAAFVPCDVELAIPRFRVAWGGDLSAALGSLGLGDAFVRGRADFSGINGAAPGDPAALWLGAARHEARIDVDEEGTRAAAATWYPVVGMAFDGREPRPERFVADHPFLFLLQERHGGEVWFIGRVADPREER